MGMQGGHTSFTTATIPRHLRKPHSQSNFRIAQNYRLGSQKVMIIAERSAIKNALLGSALRREKIDKSGAPLLGWKSILIYRISGKGRPSRPPPTGNQGSVEYIQQ